MKQYNLEGSYYEIGTQTGKILLNQKKNGYPPKYSKEILEKTTPYEEAVKEFFPEILEEFRGMADALDLDYERVLTFEISPHRFQTACLVMAISGEHTQSGYPVLARSHEWKESDSVNLRVMNTKPEGKLQSLGFTFHWPLVSRYGGINEAGVALSSASANFESSGPGIILNIAMRYMLDNCKTTEEAVEFLQKIPKVWGESYVIIDKKNTIAKVQTHGKKTITDFSDKGFESVTIHYDSPELLSYVPSAFDGAETVVAKRQAFMNNWLDQNKGNITNSMIKDVLKNHEHQMCSHGPEGLEICWSYILSP
ncbi:MAG: hypothetical protein KAJ72_02500, partial [Candidatus Heimdallarchaeota archaeon]|nr:hypothetical protein [Candidatus Heimdallarchaeota archaeon]